MGDPRTLDMLQEILDRLIALDEKQDEILEKLANLSAGGYNEDNEL